MPRCGGVHHAAAGRTTLVADLGHFTLATDSELADSLSAEERAMYDCFQLR